MKFPDVMIDIETTGLEPDTAAIIQLSAVKFNLAERTICPDVFNMGLMIPPKRYWDEGTRNWWLRDKRDLLEKILSEGRPPAQVLRAFTKWNDGSPNFFGKPTHFDYSFLQSYYRQFELVMPHHFRLANDMNSFLRGAFFPEPVPPTEVEMVGEAHYALDDCFYQIGVLFEAMERSGK